MLGKLAQSLPRSTLSDSRYDVVLEYYRRVRQELTVELPLVRRKWKQIATCLAFQYVHGIFTQLAYFNHAPQPEPLPDVGFQALPELGRENHWASETIFGALMGGTILWSLSPFVVPRKRFYTVLLYARALSVIVFCQILRIISFLSTSLPAPNYHCRSGEPTARPPPPEHWWDYIIVDVKRQSAFGCGDLIFSSHTTLALVFTLAYTTYGSYRWIKAAAWAACVALSMLIVASRKHYTVDVVVAWYTVPLVFSLLHRSWTTKRPLLDDSPSRPPSPGTTVELQAIKVDANGAAGDSSGNGSLSGTIGADAMLLAPVTSPPRSRTEGDMTKLGALAGASAVAGSAGTRMVKMPGPHRAATAKGARMGKEGKH
ncbi:unnamed protein product [Pedinophyceae sp. YPF-701]|nr:unnamed protein product [Pedinophyceae sp. YPF-701]